MTARKCAWCGVEADADTMEPINAGPSVACIKVGECLDRMTEGDEDPRSYVAAVRSTRQPRPATHPAEPSPGTVRSWRNDPCPAAVSTDYPLYARCTTCGGEIICADSPEPWWHKGSVAALVSTVGAS